MIAFGRKKHSGQAYVLYHRVDARDIDLARSAMIKPMGNVYDYIDGNCRLPTACLRMSSLTTQLFASLCSPLKDSLLQS